MLFSIHRMKTMNAIRIIEATMSSGRVMGRDHYPDSRLFQIG
jgi:hypothetical protein